MDHSDHDTRPFIKKIRSLSTGICQGLCGGAVDEIEQALRTFPARNPEKPYGFTEALRRKPIDGKYAAFYRIDEGEGIVCVERILHSKADFNRIHFGN